jgi:membrane protein implicated in regulation of membrane protease activity
MGAEDRLSRVIAGAILVIFAMITGNFVGWLGIIPLVTGIVGWCPLYGALGIDTSIEHREDTHH